MRGLRKVGQYWHYRFSYKGHRYEGSTEEKDERRAELVRADKMREAIEEKVNPLFRKAPTLEKFSEQFLEWVDTSPRLSDSYRKYLRNGWRLMLRQGIVAMTLDAIDGEAADGLEIGGSNSNVNNALRTLRRMLSYARERKILRHPPKIELFEEEGRDRLIEPWVEDLLLASASDWMRAALILGLDTGMRPGEISRLRWENFNWTEGTILVERGKSRRARRTLALTTRASAELKARMAKLGGEWVFPSTGSLSGRASKSGHVLSSTFDRTITVLKDKINADRGRQPRIPADVVFYCTRHTFATMFLVHGGDVGTLMYLMGHASITTTQKYLRLVDALKGAEVMDRHNKAKRGIALAERRA